MRVRPSSLHEKRVKLAGRSSLGVGHIVILLLGNVLLNLQEQVYKGF